MIISKTPLRIPFGGGLTDLKKYASQFGGATVSVTIDKNLYAGIKKNVDGYINLKYKDVHEKVSSIRDVKNDLIREALILTRLDQTPVDVYVMADLNSESGLGSSGSLTVGLLNAMHAYKGEQVSVEQLIEEAAHIEIDVLDSASGFHDPSICALGGLNLIEYDGEHVSARPISLPPVQEEVLQKRLLFFYNGRHYKTKPSLDLLNSHMEEAEPELHRIKQVAYDLEEAQGRGDFHGFGELIQEQQRLKQELPGKFSDDYVVETVQKINDLGGFVQLPGGKIGAFLMVYCPEDQQNRLRRELSDMKELQFSFSGEGTRVTQL